jgi:hypothetical protein
MAATSAAEGPTRTSARKSASSPTSNSRTSTPISANTCSVGSPRTKAIPRSPKSDGSKFPAPIPTRSSPRTDGCPHRSATTPPHFAATTRRARANRTGPARDGVSAAPAHAPTGIARRKSTPPLGQRSRRVGIGLATRPVEAPRKPGPHSQRLDAREVCAGFAVRKIGNPAALWFLSPSGANSALRDAEWSSAASKMRRGTSRTTVAHRADDWPHHRLRPDYPRVERSSLDRARIPALHDRKTARDDHFRPADRLSAPSPSAAQSHQPERRPQLTACTA